MKPHGRAKTVHSTVLPTTRQRAITAAGSGVYWLDGDQVLVPYGVHDFTHEPSDDEDWDFTDWRARGEKNWQADWRISHPHPAPDASRWGLIPVSLHRVTTTKTGFDLTEAQETMQLLEHARWHRRRADARELHAQRQQPRPDHPRHTPAEEPLAFPTPRLHGFGDGRRAEKPAGQHRTTAPAMPQHAAVPSAGAPTVSSSNSVGRLSNPS